MKFKLINSKGFLLLSCFFLFSVVVNASMYLDNNGKYMLIFERKSINIFIKFIVAQAYHFDFIYLKNYSSK